MPYFQELKAPISRIENYEAFDFGESSFVQQVELCNDFDTSKGATNELSKSNKIVDY